MLRRILKLALILLLLWLAVLGVYGTWWALQPHDLYDRYAKLVIKHIDVPQPGLLARWLNLKPASDHRIIKGWEREFGKDPRYWQLLHTAEIADDERDSGAIVRAIDQGIYDAGTFQLLDIRAVEEDAGEPRVLEYFDMAIACDPSNAWFYYRKADYLMDLGEVERSWEMLRKGNTAPRFITPYPFPTGEAYKRAKTAKSTEEKAVVGYLMNDPALPNYIRMKESYKNANVCFAMGYDLAYADDLLTRAKRMGQSQDEGLLSCTVAAVLARVTLEYLHDECLVMTPQTESEYQSIIATLDSGKEISKQASNEAKALGLPQPNMSPGGFPVMPTLTKQDYIAYCEAAGLDAKYVAQYREIFDCLDPPPFAAWANGQSRFDKPPKAEVVKP